MLVVAIVNRKGGCGKSTLATHLAVHFAQHEAHQVGLADLDRQQSATLWFRLRESGNFSDRQRLRLWPATAKNLVRPTQGLSHLVVDTAGGLETMELARVVMASDVLILPLRDSLFDRMATAHCIAELRRLPRVAQGRCHLALVGVAQANEARMAGTGLEAWAAEQGLPLIGCLRENSAYPRCPEKGLTLLDGTGAQRQRQVDLAQWQPIFQWLSQAHETAQKHCLHETRPIQPRQAASRSILPQHVALPRQKASDELAAAALSAEPSEPISDIHSATAPQMGTNGLGQSTPAQQAIHPGQAEAAPLCSPVALSGTGAQTINTALPGKLARRTRMAQRQTSAKVADEISANLNGSLAGKVAGSLVRNSSLSASIRLRRHRPTPASSDFMALEI